MAVGAPTADLTLQQRARDESLPARARPRFYPPEEAELDALVHRLLKRGVDPEGMQRQLSALLGSGDLRRYSRRIAAPTLVIHGDRDRLVRKAGGVAIARAVANAKLHIMRVWGMICRPR